VNDAGPTKSVRWWVGPWGQAVCWPSRVNFSGRSQWAAGWSGWRPLGTQSFASRFPDQTCLSAVVVLTPQSL